VTWIVPSVQATPGPHLSTCCEKKKERGVLLWNTCGMSGFQHTNVLWKLWNIDTMVCGKWGKHPKYAYCERLSIAEIPCAAMNVTIFPRVRPRDRTVPTRILWKLWRKAVFYIGYVDRVSAWLTDRQGHGLWLIHRQGTTPRRSVTVKRKRGHRTTGLLSFWGQAHHTWLVYLHRIIPISRGNVSSDTSTDQVQV
jgi:hypothetical protein